jgi:hypothetical protein
MPGCKAKALRDGDGRCFHHSKLPQVVKRRQEARSKGGRKSKLVKMPYIDSIDSIDDLKKILLDCMNELRLCGSDNVISKARAVGFLVNIAAGLIKDADFEQRIAKLESLTDSTS